MARGVRQWPQVLDRDRGSFSASPTRQPRRARRTRRDGPGGAAANDQRIEHR